MPHKHRFGRVVPFVRTKVRVGTFVRDIDQPQQTQILHLPHVVVIANIADVAEEPAGDRAQMKVARDHAGINIRGNKFIVAGHLRAAMVHDVVEVNPQPEPMRDAHHFEEFVFCAVARANRSALVLVAEVKRIEEIVAHRKPAHGLGRRRQPKAGVTRLSDLRHLLRHLGPRLIEQLEHGLAAADGRESQQGADETDNAAIHDVGSRRLAKKCGFLKPAFRSKPGRRRNPGSRSKMCSYLRFVRHFRFFHSAAQGCTEVHIGAHKAQKPLTFVQLRANANSGTKAGR